MMKLAEVMKKACEKGVLIPAFNAAYLPMIKAVSDALAARRVVGMIEVARPDVEKFGARSISAVADEFRKAADRKYLFLHLDHVPVIDENQELVDWKSLIREGLDAGFDSVMIDGSRLPFDENVEVAGRVCAMAHPEGVLVEAELGAVFGHETTELPPYEEIFAKKLGFTDPGQAAKFVRRTGVDWLSVSTGTIHGAISGAAKDRKKVCARIDVEHLKKLKEAAGIPLVLHGGSGVDAGCVRLAAKNGITKINIGAEIRQAWEKAYAASPDVESARNAVIEVVDLLVRETYGIENSADILIGR